MNGSIPRLTLHTLVGLKQIGIFDTEGWQVSAGNCTHCWLPLFSNSINGSKCCVMYGPINNIANYNCIQGQSLEPNKVLNKDNTKTMVDRVMEGWSIIECSSVHLPDLHYLLVSRWDFGKFNNEKQPWKINSLLTSYQHTKCPHRPSLAPSQSPQY